VPRSPYRSELSYIEALEFVGQRDSRALELGRRLAGVPAAAATVATVGQVDFLGLRDEVVGWGQAAVRRLRSWLSGADRYSRSQLLCAAHTVIVIAAFYEGLEDAARAIGVDLGVFRLTRAKQAALATEQPVPGDRRELVEMLVGTPMPLPTPERPYERAVEELRTFYTSLFERMSKFLEDSASPKQPGFSVARQFAASEERVVTAAVRQYEEMFVHLRKDVPEFDVWMSMKDGQATRSAIERIPAALEEAGRREMAKRAAELVKSYETRLERLAVDESAMPAGIRSPTLGESYVSPCCRARRVSSGDPGAETWWPKKPVWPDAYAQMAGLLMQPDATRCPVVVLGQPGSGKTSLLRVLAAGLPRLGFLAIFVELRSVSASAPVQTQIEESLYQQSGRHLEWPDIASAGGGALPVVLVDGLDELLQASRSDHADYLERVQEFQRREEEFGRPIAVVVTSRTVAGTRVRFPACTTVVRLEPFNDMNIVEWLQRWNRRALPGLRASGVAPLTVEGVTAHGELAREPLLLLMLALYHSGGNAIATSDSSRARMYEHMLREFARREIRKTRGVVDAEETQVVEHELRQLSVVAAAMFVRGRQAIRDTELEDDLATFDAGSQVDASSPRPSAREIIGRFFFVHESTALEERGSVEHTYEFLHATFGEFLFARLVVEALRDLSEEREHQAKRLRPSPIDAGLLYALTSFAPLTAREQALDFCRELLDDLRPKSRREIYRLAVELVRDSMQAHPTWSFSSYVPVERTVPARYAAFSLNLVLLALLAHSPAKGSPRRDTVDNLVGSTASWRSFALLWQSQLGQDGWRSLLSTIRLEVPLHVRDDDNRARDVPCDNWVVRMEGREDVSLWDSVPWFVEFDEDLGTVRFDKSLFPDVQVPADDPLGTTLRHVALTGAASAGTELAHAVAPLYEVGVGLGRSLQSGYVQAPLARALLWLRLAEASAETSARRLDVYLMLLTAAVHDRRFRPPHMPIVWRQFVEDAAKLPEAHLLEIVVYAIDIGLIDGKMARAALHARSATVELGEALLELSNVLAREEEIEEFEVGDVEGLRIALEEKRRERDR
jgi:hypothetical protein